jgi:hypothetical protein
MANIYRNIFIRGLTDILGNRSAYCKTHSGKIIPVGKALFDDNWKYMHVEKDDPAAMRAAIVYADFAKTQDVYLKRELDTGVSAYYIAIMDWFEAPQVLEINVDSWTGKPGQTIRVKARDNIEVASVMVVIRDMNDNVLEMGEAVQSKAGNPWWKYTTKSYVLMEPFPIVEATARDLAGNEDTFVIS